MGLLACSVAAMSFRLLYRLAPHDSTCSIVQNGYVLTDSSQLVLHNDRRLHFVDLSALDGLDRVQQAV